MKYHLFFYIILFSLYSSAQDSLKQVIVDSTCFCIGEALDNEVNTKFDFEYDFDTCMDSLVSRLKRYDSKYSTTEEVNNFIHNDLKKSCNRYYEVDSLKHLYSTHAFESIASSEDCEIMKSGIFINYGDKDSLRIIMRKKEQIIEYKDGTYTKSKIKWIDDCSYKVTRVKSTNAEDSRIKPGHVMQVNIVYVKNSEIIFYEILLNAKAYSGRMIKISD